MIKKTFVGIENVMVTICDNDLDILCNTGKYSLTDNFEDNLDLKCTEEIKFIRHEFGNDAKVLFAYIIGLCEDYGGDDDKVNTIPYDAFNITVKVCVDGVVISWSKKISKV